MRRKNLFNTRYLTFSKDVGGEMTSPETSGTFGSD